MSNCSVYIRQLIGVSFLNTLLVTMASAKQIPPSELYQFLNKPDSSFHFDWDPSRRQIDLTSQTWQGVPWKHAVIFSEANPSGLKGVALLFVTGGHPNSSILGLIEKNLRIPTAVLCDIPNQPLYGGLTEDDLISYTFQKYLETEDASWPLLFPMAKSVIRTMDAVEAITSKSANPIHRFIISGASKRGWTSWLVGTSLDRRVDAIAPMVIDNLNLNAQMKAQISEWGKYSDQIVAYSKTGFLDKLSTPAAARLARMVDPYSYRKNLKVPTLVVKGSNDQYWTVDAMDRYWSDIHVPKWEVTVPNVGHNLGGGAEALETVGQFSLAVEGAFPMPRESWKLTPDADRTHCNVSLKASGRPLKKVVAWIATSKDLDFRPSTYVAQNIDLDPNRKGARASINLPKTGNVALYLEATYEGSEGTFRLCSPTKLIDRKQR